MWTCLVFLKLNLFYRIDSWRSKKTFWLCIFILSEVMHFFKLIGSAHFLRLWIWFSHTLEPSWEYPFTKQFIFIRVTTPSAETQPIDDGSLMFATVHHKEMMGISEHLSCRRTRDNVITLRRQVIDHINWMWLFSLNIIK